MVRAIRELSLEEFLVYDDGTDSRYELVDGTLVEMPTESTLNTQIAVFLLTVFLQMGISAKRVGIKHQIAVKSRKVSAREPDLVIHSEESISAIAGAPQAIIKLGMPLPLAVVEIVSPGDANHQRDYEDKRWEYAKRGIPEYWLIDPERQTITVLTLVEQQYVEHGVFQGENQINSALVGILPVTATQVLKAGD